MSEQTTLTKPGTRLRAEQLPVSILSSLSELQKQGLAFGAREMKVVTARVQTFQLGSSSAGSVAVAGPTVALGERWGAFAGLGSINSLTINQFKTDVQIKLEEPQSAEKAFLNYSLPFEITLSIDPGETLRIYFARGGLTVPKAPGDYRLGTWAPFVAENLETGQLVPIDGLPTLEKPVIKGRWLGLFLGLLGLAMLFTGGDATSGGFFCLALGGVFLYRYFSKQEAYRTSLEQAFQSATQTTV